MIRIFWTHEEMDSVIAEGLRLTREGDTGSVLSLFNAAQLALPIDRRRHIYTSSKIPWFVQPVNETRTAIEASKRPRKAKAPTPLAATLPEVAAAPLEAPAPAPAPGPVVTQIEERPRSTKVHWTDEEKLTLCATAAALMSDLGANSPRDALEKAIVATLPPNRHRRIFTMTSVADWYFPLLKEQRELLIAQRALQRTNDAISAKLDEEAQAAAQAAAEAAAAEAAKPAPPSGLNALLSAFGGWHQVREHLVQELASIIAEGVQRGLSGVNLTQAAPQDDKPVSTGAEAVPVLPKHVPFVSNPTPKVHATSILVVGLKDAVASQIRAEFGGTLDMRFISPDKSKDQMRLMADNADVTIAVTDFLSHSHTAICKSRSRNYVESSGGITRLRSQLAQLAQLHTNGAAHAA